MLHSIDERRLKLNAFQQKKQKNTANAFNFD